MSDRPTPPGRPAARDLDEAAPPATVRALVDAQAVARPDAVYALALDDGGDAMFCSDGSGGGNVSEGIDGCDAGGSGARLTFGALGAACRAVTRALRRHGVVPGDTVSLVMPNGLATIRLLLGAMHGGVCVNPVNLLSQPEQLRYVLDHSDCKLVFAAPLWADRVRDALGRIDRPIELVVVDADAAGGGAFGDGDGGRADDADGDGGGDAGGSGDGGLPRSAAAARTDAPPDPDAVALLMYTSGTTGVPKGVMLTQANLAANARAIGVEHGLTEDDRVLAVLPLYHINAFAVTMLAPLAHGGSLAMPPRFSAARFWTQAASARCTWLNVVPTMISYLLEGTAPAPAQTPPPKFCRSASAALPPEHLRAFEQRFGIGIVETMGLTETVAPAFSNPLDPARRKPGSVGRASGGEARVIDAALAPVPDGTTGELAIRGPHVMKGYYKDAAATAASFTPDGWLRTGDLGRRDADGFFFVTGRIKELIIKGGENIAPREIDEVLLAHPAVLEAAAVGIPDRHYGQDIMACVVLREGASAGEASLRDHCVARLGPYKSPKEFRFVADLPRGPSGKVQRLKLLDWL